MALLGFPWPGAGAGEGTLEILADPKFIGDKEAGSSGIVRWQEENEYGTVIGKVDELITVVVEVGQVAYSAASRPPIPIEVGHRFRFKSATYSD